MKNLKIISISLFMVLSISGCETLGLLNPVDKGELNRITLESALESVGAGLVLMKKKQMEENEGKDFRTGLSPSEVEVKFNISAQGDNKGKIYIEASTPPNAPAVGKVGGEYGKGYISSRGNQITVKFRSILFSKSTKKTTTDPKTKAKTTTVTIEGITDPKVLNEIIRVLDAKEDQLMNPPVELPRNTDGPSGGRTKIDVYAPPGPSKSGK